ncbi:hypothetical protein Aph01nite_39910 [Acrocarpospora phusangensis]|uniref:Uncharacterized protein n=1 Tax=Acrocarpospora phusangensis TaxID=1070424 RepID=A0A919UL26_9ACTN|nr:hypothetical protein Aph01nite_39910 [Acrocarpospora phusangensis]
MADTIRQSFSRTATVARPPLSVNVCRTSPGVGLGVVRGVLGRGGLVAPGVELGRTGWGVAVGRRAGDLDGRGPRADGDGDAAGGDDDEAGIEGGGERARDTPDTAVGGAATRRGAGGSSPRTVACSTSPTPSQATVTASAVAPHQASVYPIALGRCIGRNYDLEVP